MDGIESYYDQLAPFYDGITQTRTANSSKADVGGEVNVERPVAFYVDRAVEADGPVLEIGCGTGRVYIELLRAGVDAFGIDVSRNMLDELEGRVESEGVEPRVRQADMRTFTPRREYDAVFVPGRGFLHNITREDQLRALENVHDALAPGGRLICNFFTPDFEAIAEHVGEPVVYEFRHDGRTYTVRTREEFEDRVHNVVRGVRTVEDEGGNVVAEFTGRLKLVTKDEFASLLESTGFDTWDVYGGFDGEPHTSVDQELVWIASA